MDSKNDCTSKVNKLQGEYLSSSLNKVWTIDITTIKRKYYWFFIMDLASRRIVGYDVLDHDYTSQEAIHTVEKTLLLQNISFCSVNTCSHPFLMHTTIHTLLYI